MSFTTFLYLIIAFGIGWLLGAQFFSHEKKAKPARSGRPDSIPSVTISDVALERFIQSLEVTGETLETHLALAALYRQRGELDRATRLHQNLLDREDLNESQRQFAKLELAKDYLKAGMHDFAENQLQKLVEKAPAHRVAAMHSLLELYQEASEWDKAIHVANVLADEPEDRLPKNYNRLRSHFYCEIAELAMSEQDTLSARTALSRAAHYGGEGIRPKLLLAKLEFNLGSYSTALGILDQLEYDQVELWEPVLELYREIFAQIGDPESLLQRMKALYQSTGYPELLNSTYEVIRQYDGQGVALDFLSKAIATNPSAEALRLVLDDAPEQVDMGTVRGAIEHLVSGAGDRTSYQCGGCGYVAKVHQWRCPTCHRWDLMVYNPQTARTPSTNSVSFRKLAEDQE